MRNTGLKKYRLECRGLFIQCNRRNSYKLSFIAYIAKTAMVLFA